MSQSDVVECHMPPLHGERDGFRLSCLVPIDRQNGNTEMYVDGQSSTWDFLSKLVLQEYGAAQEHEEDKQATVAPAAARALPVVAPPSPEDGDNSPALPVVSCTEGSDDGDN